MHKHLLHQLYHGVISSPVNHGISKLMETGYPKIFRNPEFMVFVNQNCKPQKKNLVGARITHLQTIICSRHFVWNSSSKPTRTPMNGHHYTHHATDLEDFFPVRKLGSSHNPRSWGLIINHVSVRKMGPDPPSTTHSSLISESPTCGPHYCRFRWVHLSKWGRKEVTKRSRGSR